MTIAELENVTAGYDAGPVLRNVDFRIAEGETVGLLGPNGSGKTTLMRVLAGALDPEAGSVRLLGRDIASLDARELAREVAFLPQLLHVPFSFTAEEMVEMGRFPHTGRFAGLGDADREVVEEAMGLVDVIHLRGRLVTELSGGERQRVFLAQALAQQPKLLLLDEPATHLDVQHQVELFELLGAVNRRGVTVFAILHDLNLAAQYLDRLAYLKSGEIVAQGPPGELVQSALIERTFGIPLEVVPAEGERRPAVRYARVPTPPEDAPGKSVHLICGGGWGRPLLRALTARGHRVSAGVLNRGDSDEVLARNLGVRVITIPPFTPVSAQAHEKNTQSACAADVVVVSPHPVGPGNMANLRAAEAAQNKGVPVVLVDPDAVSDHTGGEAREALEDLLQKGAQRFGQNSQVVEFLQNLT
jgi:iron complex transport system ATP-binding protein